MTTPTQALEFIVNKIKTQINKGLTENDIKLRLCVYFKVKPELADKLYRMAELQNN